MCISKNKYVTSTHWVFLIFRYFFSRCATPTRDNHPTSQRVLPRDCTRSRSLFAVSSVNEMKIFLFQCKHVLALKRLINTTTYLFSLFNPPCRFPPSRVITRSFEHTNFPNDPSPWVRHSCSVVCDAARNRETARKLTARMHRLGSDGVRWERIGLRRRRRITSSFFVK